MFDPLEQELDFEWLKSNGWTVSGNLAFLHLLYEFGEKGVLSLERIEQIVMQYEAEEQIQKINEACKAFFDLK